MKAPAGLLELVDVYVEYQRPDGLPPLVVLDGLSLTLRAAEIYCIAGRSGSGKTTLLNVAACLLTPTAGEVRWLDEVVGPAHSRQASELRRNVLGYVFQGAGLIESLTAAENVAVAGVPRGLTSEDGERVRLLLNLVGLADRANHLPSQLSGGERQRVALARGLFNDPRALIVDEPTANLDRAAADAIAVLLRALRDAGRAVLVASHDPHLVDQADRRLTLD